MLLFRDVPTHALGQSLVTCTDFLPQTQPSRGERRLNAASTRRDDQLKYVFGTAAQRATEPSTARARKSVSSARAWPGACPQHEKGNQFMQNPQSARREWRPHAPCAELRARLHH